MRQSLTCSIDLIRGLHRSQQFWQKRSGCKMLARERVKLHRGGMTSQRRSGWKFCRICVKRTLNGEPHGCFQMRFCIDAVTLTVLPC
ncbi:hypothetical protein Goklo_028951 [Gossypium klotzschianum]|uniref:Uncharacterized protein n=1 Tax=Gossypium klotzschianum TaxID=34286 RepID=A0A7J8W9W2_9ROSI|nr:hypothetical protein [Gossypium klotzschianum]